MNVAQPTAWSSRTHLRHSTMLLLGAVAAVSVLASRSALAQQRVDTTTAVAARPLSLDEAIRLAARESEVLQVARAGVTRAEGQVKQARSLYLPQLNGNLAYARTLRSQFSALAGSAPVDTSTVPRPQALCSP